MYVTSEHVLLCSLSVPKVSKTLRIVKLSPVNKLPVKSIGNEEKLKICVFSRLGESN